MIWLAQDCLVFQTARGENIPFSADMISVEVTGESAEFFDGDFIKHAAAAVFHYFRDELGRESVTVAEFSQALENLLRGFSLAASAQTNTPMPRVVQSDLCRLVSNADETGDLFFFPRLRDELREQLSHAPQMLCFRGLRECVKQLAGTRRWSTRCQGLQDEIVEFLRSCMTQESGGLHCALIVK